MTFVRPLLEYASSVWAPHETKYKNLIESVQHRFLRSLAFKQGKSMSITDHDYDEIMKKNKIPTLQHRRDINDIFFVYKVLNNLTFLPELLEDFTFRVNSRNTRNKTLFIEKTSRTKYSQYKPFNRLVRLLNQASLLDETIDPFCDSTSTFKNKLVSLNEIKIDVLS
ncbi:hypothetical protein WDU94_000011 [Cyamophila willieti]